jgi:hypothetical protein
VHESELYIQNHSCAGTDAKCPKCGSEWRIFWIKPGFPRVKGPVWETSERLAHEQWSKITEKKEEK